MRRFLSILASLTRFATLAVALMLACLAPQANALLTPSDPILSEPIASQAHAPESILIIEEVYPVGYADDGEYLDLCVCVEPETHTRVFCIVKSPTGLAFKNYKDSDVPWYLPSSSVPYAMNYTYGTTWHEDAVCGFANWGIALNNGMYGITDGLANFDYDSLRPSIHDPAAVLMSLPIAAPLAYAAAEAGLLALISRGWMGVRASSIGMKLTRSKGATGDLILTGKQTLVPASQFGGTGGLRIKALSGFGNQASAQYLQSLAKSSGDDALIGFIQNGKVILQRSYRGSGKYYGHADFIRSGIIQQSDDLLGFQVIKYNGKITVHGMSELNGSIDSQGRLPAAILQQVKNLLEITHGG